MFRGVNLAGAEFGPVGGLAHNTDYAYQARWNGYFTHLLYVNGGTNVFRLPFKWERLQPVGEAEFDAAEWKRLRDTVRDYRSLGVSVVLDPHNYAKYFGVQVTAAQLADLWRRLAIQYRDDTGVIFGLMNEPAGVDAAAWWYAAQTAINTIRSEGANNIILVPGVAWTGAHSWVSSGNAENALTIVDPLNNYAFEVHQYVDSNSSGTSGNAVSENIGVDRIAAVTSWAEANRRHLFLGEFGVSSVLTNRIANHRMLSRIEDRPDVWIGWTAWGAGGRWANDYYFRLDPPVSSQTALLFGQVAA